MKYRPFKRTGRDAAMDAEEERKPVSVTETHVRQHPNGARATRTIQQSYEPESKMIDPYADPNEEKRTGREASNQAKTAKDAKDAKLSGGPTPASTAKATSGAKNVGEEHKILTNMGYKHTGSGNYSHPSGTKWSLPNGGKEITKSGKDTLADLPTNAVERIQGADFKRTGRDALVNSNGRFQQDAQPQLSTSPNNAAVPVVRRASDVSVSAGDVWSGRTIR